MANDKKIAKNIKFINYCLKEIENKTSKLEMVDKSKEKEKLSKQIESLKTSIVMEAKSLNKNGGNLDEIINGGNEFQIGVLKELFPQGLAMDNVGNQKERNAIIQKWKKWIEKLVELEEKYPPYDKSLPIKDKLKSKIYKQEKDIGYYMLLNSQEGLSAYDVAWNYGRDFATSTEFSDDERKIISRCIEIGREYEAYFNKKFEFIDKNLNAWQEKKVSNSVEELKEAIVNMYSQMIPGFMEEVYDISNYSDEEIKEESKRITIEACKILCNQPMRDELLIESEQILQGDYKEFMANMGVVGKVGFNKNAKAAIKVMLIMEKVGFERGMYSYVCAAGKDIKAGDLKRVLEKYPVEEMLQ